MSDDGSEVSDPQSQSQMDYFQLVWNEAIRARTFRDELHLRVRARAKTLAFSILGFVGFFVGQIKEWPKTNCSVVVLTVLDALAIITVVWQLFVLETPKTIDGVDPDLDPALDDIKSLRPIQAAKIVELLSDFIEGTSNYDRTLGTLHDRYKRMMMASIFIFLSTLAIYVMIKLNMGIR